MGNAETGCWCPEWRRRLGVANESVTALQRERENSTTDSIESLANASSGECSKGVASCLVLSAIYFHLDESCQMPRIPSPPSLRKPLSVSRAAFGLDASVASSWLRHASQDSIRVVPPSAIARLNRCKESGTAVSNYAPIDGFLHANAPVHPCPTPTDSAALA